MTNEQTITRLSQALRETLSAIQKMERPAALQREDNLIEWHYGHAEMLALAIDAQA